MKEEVRSANLRSVCRVNRELSSRLILSPRSCYNLCVYVRLFAVYRVRILMHHRFHRLSPRWHAVPRIFLITVFIVYILFACNRDNYTRLRAVISVNYMSIAIENHTVAGQHHETVFIIEQHRICIQQRLYSIRRYIHVTYRRASTLPSSASRSITSRTCTIILSSSPLANASAMIWGILAKGNLFHAPVLMGCQTVTCYIFTSIDSILITCDYSQCILIPA